MITSLDKNSLRMLMHGRTEKPVDCRIRAANDVEALERWLDEYFDKPTTFRSYKKEGERFLVWCSLARNVSLQGLMREDVEAYIEFLRDPKPRETWCGPRRKKNEHGVKTWYPFSGPLGGSAIKTALACLNSFMSFLVDANYVKYNPFTLIRRKTRFKQKFDEAALTVQQRILEEQEWQAFLEAATRKNDPRALFLVKALYFLGLRINEMAHARWRDCKKVNGKWWFFVLGKGDKLGKVPVNSEFLHAIMTYRYNLGLTPLPGEDEERAVISSPRDQTKGLSSRQMSNVIKMLAQEAAAKFSPGSVSQQKLLRFSPHWLRHLSASRQDLAGISITHIKSNLRHQNEQTTRIYVHAFDDDRHREMEKLRI